MDFAQTLKLILPGSEHQGKLLIALSLTWSNKLEAIIKTKISWTLHKRSSLFCQAVNTYENSF